MQDADAMQNADAECILYTFVDTESESRGSMTKWLINHGGVPGIRSAPRAGRSLNQIEISLLSVDQPTGLVSECMARPFLLFFFFFFFFFPISSFLLP